MTTTVFIFLSFILLNIKHFLADYPFQSYYMVHGKAQLDGWLSPLMSHAGVHAALTMVVFFFLGLSFWPTFLLAFIDFITHIFVDRTKANYSRTLPPSSKSFWVYFGLDQLAHHLTYVALVMLATYFSGA